MVAELVVMITLAPLVRARLHPSSGDQRGMTTETVVITALLVLLAIGAIGVIANAVNDKAEDVADEVDGA